MITTEEWLTALESGKYPRGRGRLKSAEGYCCLGVGSHLCGTLDDEGKDTINGCIRFPHKFISDLPDEMWRLQTVNEYDINVNQWGSYTTVSNLNDCGHSFVQIAQKVRDTIKDGLVKS